MPRRSHIAVAALALSMAGCISYNEQCQGLVENPTEVIGKFAEEVLLDRPNTRHANNAIGQIGAEAFLHAWDEDQNAPPAQFAVLNGGAIREPADQLGEGICTTRSVIPKDSDLTNGLLHQILLFENLVISVDLTEPELLEMMEHSVERLSSAGQSINSPPGFFLHIAGGTVDVDCSKEPGARIVRMEVTGNPANAAERVQRVITGNPDAGFIRVAMPSFLLRGGDGYTVLEPVGNNPERRPVQAGIGGGIDSNIAADYIREHYNPEAGKGEGIKKITTPREPILFRQTDGGVPTCAVAGRPG